MSAAYSLTVDLIDTRELAKLVGRKPRTILAWRQAGKLTDQATVGRIPVWALEDAQRWAEVGCPDDFDWPALDLSDLHTSATAADLLHTTPEMVAYHRDHDDFPPPDVMVGRHRLWRTATVARWADEMWPPEWRAAQRARWDALDRLTEHLRKSDD